jgi:hypothetical protein
MWCCKKWKNTALPLRDDTAAIAGKLSGICSRSGVGKNCFWYYHAKAVCHRLRRRNLNAYNVLKQGTIAKADDYAGYIFTPESFTILMENPWLIMRTKKQRRSLNRRGKMTANENDQPKLVIGKIS